VKQYRERNLEAVQAKDRARYHAAPEKHHRKHYPYGTFKRDPGKQARWFRSWLERNREKFYASIRSWTAAHPEVRIASANNRRTRTRANGGRFTAAEWRTLKKRYAYRCLACGVQEPAIRLQPDHIIPVSKGGSGNIDNIQPLCPRCNRVKHTKEVDYRSAAAFAPPPRVAGSVSVSDEEQ
jgi:5-methylcytosine-specific restriction endonuclease McrA